MQIYVDVEHNGRIDLDASDVGEPARVAARGRSPGGERAKTPAARSASLLYHTSMARCFRRISMARCCSLRAEDGAAAAAAAAWAACAGSMFISVCLSHSVPMSLECRHFLSWPPSPHPVARFEGSAATCVRPL